MREGSAYICNFGLSRLFSDPSQRSGMTSSSPSSLDYRYAAPERIGIDAELASNTQKATILSDMYEFGFFIREVRFKACICRLLVVDS